MATRHRARTSTRWHFAFGICCHSNATHAPIANLPNSAPLGAPPTIPPSYIQVRAVVWACSHGQTHRQTHRCVWPLYISHCLRLTWNVINTKKQTRMWANAQRDGRPAEHRWRPLFNAAKFGWCSLLDCRAVTLPRRETRWNLHGCLKLPDGSQPLVKFTILWGTCGGHIAA